MEPSDEVRELRRLRDAVERAGREAGSVSWVAIPLVIVIGIAGWVLADIATSLNRIADCHCAAASMEAE